MRKIIIFGAGKSGIELLKKLGREQVFCFCDNDKNKSRETLFDLPIISPDELTKLYPEMDIIVAVDDLYAASYIRHQLELMGVEDFALYASEEKRNQMSIIDQAANETKLFNQRNERLRYYDEKSEEIDPCRNIDEFRELVLEAKQDIHFPDGWIQSVGRNVETLRYGHFDLLKRYSGMKQITPELFPTVAHGGIFLDNFIEYRTATIFTSPYFKRLHNGQFPYVPIFLVGPYINYVDTGGYKDDKAEESALIFSIHANEVMKSTIEYEKFMDRVILPLKKKYQRIVLCVYWSDLEDELYSRLAKEGIVVVSAGFRSDPLFIVRLRRILDMCHDVYIYGITTAIIYALALNKRVYYDSRYDIEFQYISEGLEKEHKLKARITEKVFEIFEGILKKNNGCMIDEYCSEDRAFVDDFLGIGIKKSPDDIKLIYEISKDIWNNCNYFENQYPIGVYKTYWQYQERGEYAKLVELSKSLGRGFWNI